jgi:uncharacterized protein (DUF433 family)
MPQFDRITFDPNVMGGKPCIRGMRVTVGTIVGLLASGATREEVLADYPYLDAEDIATALSYAAWRCEEIDVPLSQESPPSPPRMVPKLGTQHGSVLSMEHFDDPLDDFKEYTE